MLTPYCKTYIVDDLEHEDKEQLVLDVLFISSV